MDYDSIGPGCPGFPRRKLERGRRRTHDLDHSKFSGELCIVCVAEPLVTRPVSWGGWHQFHRQVKGVRKLRPPALEPEHYDTTGLHA